MDNSQYYIKKIIEKLENNLIKTALVEDLLWPFKDITTESLFEKNGAEELVKGKIVSKHKTKIVICGLNIIKKIFTYFNSKCKIFSVYSDGNILSSGDTLVTIESDIKSILSLERTILNFLRHLSAIATVTKEFVSIVKDETCIILDTRKTTPGMRYFEKYAVRCGGGANHRMGLYDSMLIKDTHISATGGIKTIFNNIAKNKIAFPLIVEIKSIEDLIFLISFIDKFPFIKIDRVILDNMNINLMRKCVLMCKGIIKTEASGNINYDNIIDIAKTGVNYASIGMITYSAGNVDLSMIIEPKKPI